LSRDQPYKVKIRSIEMIEGAENDLLKIVVGPNTTLQNRLAR